MEIITVTPENIGQEHICCAITDKKGECCIPAKKQWMKECFADGLTFKKLDVRGKVFIEYLPAEKAWCPINAEGYMHIDCFWVSGQYKGQGYANLLLQECIDDAKAKGMCGLTVLSSKKKLPYLSEPGYLKHKGFQIADTSAPHYILYYLPFHEGASVPTFKSCAKDGKTDEPGLVLYYSHQCPHTAKYVPLIEKIAARRGRSLTLHQLTTAQDAQNAPAPFTTYSFFYNGVFITNEIFSEKNFEKFLDEHPA